MMAERSLSNSSILTDTSKEMDPKVLVQDARFQLGRFPNLMCPTSNQLSAIQVMTALLDHPPNEEGQLYIAKAIIDAVKGKGMENQALDLADLAQAWLDNLLFPLRGLIAARDTVAPSPFQTPTIEDTAVLIEKATHGNQGALKKLVYVREGLRCVISGHFSSTHAGHGVDPGDSTVAGLETAHILPLALNLFDERKLHVAAITWDMIRSWTGLDIKTVAGSEINTPKNALLLTRDYQNLFGDFFLWFIATGNPDEYRVDTRFKNDHKDTIVAFVDHSHSGIPAPSAELLALHAAFARVFHASGAAEYIDQIWEDPSAVHQLQSNGSSDVVALIHTSHASIAVF